MSGQSEGGRVKSPEDRGPDHPAPSHAQNFFAQNQYFDLFGDPAAPPRHHGGLPRHVVTEEKISKVRELASMGRTHAAIAKAIGVAIGTLHFYYFSLLNRRPGIAGRRPHEATPESRQKVHRLAAAGVSRAAIAADLGITIPTLMKHYRAQLEGGWKAAGRVAPISRKGEKAGG